MLPDLLHSITNSLSDAVRNQFLSGGLLLMIVGALMAYLRRAPGQLGAIIKRQFIVSVDVTSNDPIFNWLSIWLDQHPYSKRARCLTASLKRDHYNNVISSTPVRATATGPDTPGPEVIFTPAPGIHLMFYRNRLLWLSRERKETNPNGNNEFSFLYRETYSIRVLGHKQDVIRALIEDARQCALAQMKNEVEVFISCYGGWRRLNQYAPRPLSSVILPDDLSNSIVAQIRDFKGKRQWYRQRGIPYRLNWLLYGIPGSGKTSLISALAGEFDANLYVLSLNSEGMSDERLVEMLLEVPAGSFVLLEDIDAVVSGRKVQVTSDGFSRVISFSGLLNALDGIAAKEGCILFMTTNHIEKLDEALIRPGRVDHRIYFDYATREQALRLFQNFFPEASNELAETFARGVEGQRKSMAELQKHLLAHKGDADPSSLIPLFHK